MMLFLQLRNELLKLFAKKRTYIAFGVFFLAQSAVALSLRYGPGHRRLLRSIERGGYEAMQYLSNLTVATNTLLAAAYVLLPVCVALIGGDLVAKEAEDGTLRMILSRPVSRLRLLLLKWLAGVLFGCALVAAIGLYAPAFARLFFPSGGLFVFLPRPGQQTMAVFNGVNAWEHYGAAHLALMVKAATILSLAFMFSCFNVKPAAATVLAIAVVFICMILQNIPFLEDIREWFITWHLNLWTGFFQPTIPWPDVGKSLAVLAGYNVAFLAVGCWVFQRRDIKS